MIESVTPLLLRGNLIPRKRRTLRRLNIGKEKLFELFELDCLNLTV